MDKLLEVPPEELNSEDNDSKDITSDTWKSSAKVMCQAFSCKYLPCNSDLKGAHISINFSM